MQNILTNGFIHPSPPQQEVQQNKSGGRAAACQFQTKYFKTQ